MTDNNQFAAGAIEINKIYSFKELFFDLKIGEDTILYIKKALFNGDDRPIRPINLHNTPLYTLLALPNFENTKWKFWGVNAERKPGKLIPQFCLADDEESQQIFEAYRTIDGRRSAIPAENQITVGIEPLHRLYPRAQSIYTLLEIESRVELRDAPSLGFVHEGFTACIQTAHLTVHQLLQVPGLAGSKWQYLRDTKEWIPIFRAIDPAAIHECVDIAIDPEYGTWVTPKGHPRPLPSAFHQTDEE